MASPGTSFMAQQAAAWLGVLPDSAPQQLGAAAVDPVQAQEQRLATKMQTTDTVRTLTTPLTAASVIGGFMLTLSLLRQSKK